MKNNLLSNRWWAVDLVICSVWLLLIWHERRWSSFIMLIPFLRIWTSFLMHRRSKLTVIPLGFMLLLSSLDWCVSEECFNKFWEPFTCFIQTAYALFGGNVNIVQESFETLCNSGMRDIVNIIGLIWLLIIPILILIYQWWKKEMASTRLNKKNIAGLSGFTLLILFFVALMNSCTFNPYLSVVILLVGVLLGLVIFYKGEIKDILTRNEWIYLGTLGGLGACYFCGSVLSYFGSLILCLSLIGCYVLWSWWLGYKKSLFDLLLISLGVVLFWCSPYTIGFLRIILLFLSLGCVAWVCIRLALATNNKYMSTMLFALLGVLMPFLGLGYNPFSATDCQVLYRFQGYNSGKHGLLIVEGKDGKGLRDRYGMVIPAEYERIESIDPHKPYIKVYKHENFQIFDIRERKLVSEEWFYTIEEEKNSRYFYNLTSQHGAKRFITPHWDGDIEEIVDAKIVDVDSTSVVNMPQE